MARKPQVTRTIKMTEAKVMCYDITNHSMYDKVYTLPRTYKNNTEILKKVKEAYETETVIIVYIISTEIIEALYGMSEEKFIENAELLPPRNFQTEIENAN